MGSLTLNLARPTLLGETFELFKNTGATNGAGGRSSAAWTVEQTVKSRRYTRPARAATNEQKQSGKPTDPNMVEIVLDVATIDSAWRVQAVSDGAVYEIISVAAQPPVVFVRARQVP